MAFEIHQPLFGEYFHLMCSPFPGSKWYTCILNNWPTERPLLLQTLSACLTFRTTKTQTKHRSCFIGSSHLWHLSSKTTVGPGLENLDNKRKQSYIHCFCWYKESSSFKNEYIYPKWLMVKLGLSLTSLATYCSLKLGYFSC